MDPQPAPAPPTGPPPPVQSHPMIAPATTSQPPPVWGPDRETQQETGVTAGSAFTDLLSAESTDPPSPLVLLSRVATPQDWTPAFLAALHDNLRNAELLDPVAAWATFNVLLDRAVLTCNIPLVRACLAEHRWRLCIKNVYNLVTKTAQRCHKILPLLAADARFGQVFLRSIANKTVIGYGHDLGIHSDVIPTVLAIPSVDPWIVWQEALDVSVESMVAVRKIWRMGESPLVDPEWAWRRCVAADKDWRARHGGNRSDCRQQKSVEFPQPYAKLLSDLPTDIQYLVHLLLDAPSVGRIRSTCHALTSFPAHQFASRQLHSACFQSATVPGCQWDSRRFQSLLANVLSPSHRSNTLREEHVGRVLVESSRHLTDLGFSLHLLVLLNNPTHPTIAAVYLTWALHTTLTSAYSPTPATSVLLCYLLMHPQLPFEAWSLVSCHYDAAATILANEPHPPLFAVDPDQECIKRLLLHLVRTRAFPSSNWSLSATMFPDLNGAPIANQSRTRLETRLMLALATLSNSPATLDVVLDLPPELVHSRTIESHVRSYAVHSPACPPAFVAHVLERTHQGYNAVHFELLFAAPSIKGMSAQECARKATVMDVYFEYLGSAERILSVLRSIKNFGANFGVGKTVIWRGMWWWLKLADKADEGWREMRAWIKQESEQELDEAQQGEVVLEEHAVVWLTELRELWAQKNGWNTCVVQ